jgi:hypothetical protein
MQKIRKASLARLICDNSGVQSMQVFPFIQPIGWFVYIFFLKKLIFFWPNNKFIFNFSTEIEESRAII